MAFDELKFFGDLKTRPGVYFGKKSLLSLRDTLNGMELSRYFDDDELVRRRPRLSYLDGFVKWYLATYVRDSGAYASWWNHMLYLSGNNDEWAFDMFFRRFEEYLLAIHHTALPEPAPKQSLAEKQGPDETVPAQ